MYQFNNNSFLGHINFPINTIKFIKKGQESTDDYGQIISSGEDEVIEIECYDFIFMSSTMRKQLESSIGTAWDVEAIVFKNKLDGITIEKIKSFNNFHLHGTKYKLIDIIKTDFLQDRFISYKVTGDFITRSQNRL